MKTVLKTMGYLVCGALLATLLTGCAKLQPGADATVVRAQQTVQVAFETVNTFIEFDAANRPWLVANAPAVHAFAEGVRKDAPPVFRYAWEAIALYQSSKSIASGTALSGVLAKVEAIAAEARNYLLSVKPPGT